MACLGGAFEDDAQCFQVALDGFHAGAAFGGYFLAGNVRACLYQAPDGLVQGFAGEAIAYGEIIGINVQIPVPEFLLLSQKHGGEEIFQEGVVGIGLFPDAGVVGAAGGVVCQSPGGV